MNTVTMTVSASLFHLGDGEDWDDEFSAGSGLSLCHPRYNKGGHSCHRDARAGAESLSSSSQTSSCSACQSLPGAWLKMQQTRSLPTWGFRSRGEGMSEPQISGRTSKTKGVVLCRPKGWMGGAVGSFRDGAQGGLARGRNDGKVIM